MLKHFFWPKGIIFGRKGEKQGKNKKDKEEGNLLFLLIGMMENRREARNLGVKLKIKLLI